MIFPCAIIFFNFTLYADDSTLTCCLDKNLPAHEIVETINSNLCIINNWLIKNRIKVNPDKCSYIQFSYNSSNNISGLQLGGVNLNSVFNTKFLGIHLDNKLTFSTHINHIVSKISKSVGVIYKLNSYFPEFILKQMYNSLILPYITYGIESWFGAPNYLSDRVQVLQKKAIRAIFKLPYNSHTGFYFKDHNFLRLNELYLFNLSSSVFKYKNFDLNLAIALPARSDLSSHATRNRFDLSVPYFRRAKSQNSFSYQSAKAWNSIPMDVRSIDSFHCFKIKLKSLLLSGY